jgi:hypothetical protein
LFLDKYHEWQEYGRSRFKATPDDVLVSQDESCFSSSPKI